MQRVCSVKIGILQGIAVLVKNDQVRGEVMLVDDTTPKIIWVVTAIVLRSIFRDVVELGF